MTVIGRPWLYKVDKQNKVGGGNCISTRNELTISKIKKWPDC